MLTGEFTGGNTRLGLAKNIDDLFVGKTLLHGVVLMLLMRTLLTSLRVNQWGAGQLRSPLPDPIGKSAEENSRLNPLVKHRCFPVS